MDVGATRIFPRIADPGRAEASTSTRRLGRATIAACLTLAAAACVPAADSGSAAPGSASAQAHTHCPIADFEAFIQRFSDDIEFQKQSTADPLRMVRYDTQAEPEPRQVVTQVRQAEVAWPVLHRLDDLRAEGRNVALGAPTDGRAALKVWMPDTSDQQIYLFAQAPCWQLNRVIDESI